MAKNGLTDTKVRGRLADGRHSDGTVAGLSLLVSNGGKSRRWIARMRHNGRDHEKALGTLADLPLAEARDKAREWRAEIKAGKQAVGEPWTFAEAVRRYLAEHGDTFKNPKHLAQWRSTLGPKGAAYGKRPAGVVHADALQRMDVADIGLAEVLDVLKPIWTVAPESASRLRGRIEKVLAYATVHGRRTGDNPARWGGHLEVALRSPSAAKAAKRERTGRGEHHAAMPWQDVPAFVARLRELPGTAARALEFTIHCAARTSETLNMTWGEVSLAERTWTVPAARMKAKREHRVPLSDRACTILAEMAAVRVSDYVFPGQREGRALSNMAMEVLLRRERLEVTVHGFRSSFRDWAGDCTTYPREVAEAALAHAVGQNATERAYRRGDALEQRRRLMQAWAAFCGGEQADAKVVPLRA